MKKSRFTLAEVVIAVGITIIVLASASSLLVFNLYCIRFVDDRMTCSNIAKNRIEQLRSLNIDELALAGELDIRVSSMGVPDANGGFFRSTAVGELYWGTRDVTVLVKNDPKNRKISGKAEVKLVTILMDQRLVILGE